jgi:formamidopyrimidine-DNA glycosylase
MAKNTTKDKKMAAMLKDRGEERTQQRCPQCYRIIACEGPKSRYTHICKG